MELNKDTWNNRYLTNDIGWDIGYVSTPIKEYIDQLEDKSIRILIPGCGNSYEAEYLHKNGFTNVFVIDLAQEALNNLQARIPDFPSNHMICGNFFEHEGKYDLILEQTFFCAINPSLREEYVARMKKLIDIDGKLVGLLFNDKLFSDRPPYGGKKSDYINLFSKYFNKVSMEKAYNSVAPRKDRELFIVIC
jgi:hypothetical protein